MHIDYELIEREKTPLGELTLRRYRAETGEVGYEVAIDGNFLMASHGAHSEIAMAKLALDRLAGPRDRLRVLVGGLGAGHTLRAALELPGIALVRVAEIGAKVVQWNRDYFAEVNGEAVDDPRVDIRIADLADVITEGGEPYHLALLDVDNGPGWLAAQGNAGLYEVAGVQRCRDMLVPGGVLAVWSPQANPTFQRVLEQVFPHVEPVDTTQMGAEVDEPGDVVYLAYPGITGGVFR